MLLAFHVKGMLRSVANTVIGVLIFHVPDFARRYTVHHRLDTSSQKTQHTDVALVALYKVGVILCGRCAQRLDDFGCVHAYILPRLKDIRVLIAMVSKKSSPENPLQIKIFKVVKAVIDKADPEQLLQAGAPKDEYDPESRDVAMGVYREGGKKLSLGTTELAHILGLVFHWHFQPWGRPVRLFSLYFEMAKELQEGLAKIA